MNLSMNPNPDVPECFEVSYFNENSLSLVKLTKQKLKDLRQRVVFIQGDNADGAASLELRIKYSVRRLLLVLNTLECQARRNTNGLILQWRVSGTAPFSSAC